MSESTKAVFLSYASQDAEAARRICEALRAAGVEVWFDQSELVGGDAWDRKIRGQISSCTLFVPVVSAATQARREGYFRLEWKLAAQRTHMISERTAFLLPVVIDSTRDAEADVPEEFRAVQWTRLPAGETNSAFCARVKKLLSGSELEPGRPRPGERGEGAASPASRSASSPPAGRRVPAAAWAGALAVLAIGLGATWFATRKPEPAAPTAGAAPRPPVAEKSAPLANDKSIAVLPFANRSPDKENEFFTDGVHEDILTNLFNIRALRVVSRTSVEQYRGTKKGLKEIGAELGVAYILEGSVQRVGNKVRVTGQLIDARTDAHLWAKSFDKDLSDVFAIQAEIAKAIAAELQTVLSPQEQKLLERRPTENVAAYDLYLKARALLLRNVSMRASRERLLTEAVELDPNFAAAWGELAVTHGHFYSSNADRTPARLAQAEAALARATRLAPDRAETFIARGWLACWVHRDYARATTEFEIGIQLQPSNAEAIHGLATIQKLQGRWLESVANHRKALQLDPAGGELGIDFATLLEAGRRWDEVRTVREKINAARAQRQIDNRLREARLVEAIFSGTGSTKAADDWLAGMTPAQLQEWRVITTRKWRAIIHGDFAEWRRLDALTPDATDEGGVRQPEVTGGRIRAALTLAAHGDPAAARLRLGNRPAEVRAELERDPTNYELWHQMALMAALLGEKTEAVRYAKKAVELMPEALDATEGPRHRRTLAVVYAWTGDKDRAFAELTRLLRVPYGYYGSVHDLRVDPTFAPLRGDPRFEALLKDPKNMEPLF